MTLRSGKTKRSDGIIAMPAWTFDRKPAPVTSRPP